MAFAKLKQMNIERRIPGKSIAISLVLAPMSCIKETNDESGGGSSSDKETSPPSEKTNDVVCVTTESPIKVQEISTSGKSRSLLETSESSHALGSSLKQHLNASVYTPQGVVTTAASEEEGQQTSVHSFTHSGPHRLSDSNSQHDQLSGHGSFTQSPFQTQNSVAQPQMLHDNSIGRPLSSGFGYQQHPGSPLMFQHQFGHPQQQPMMAHP